MNPFPEQLLAGPFTRSTALSLGVTPRMLRGNRVVRLHPRVFRHRDHLMTRADEVKAARLALPADAALTGITRIQELGLDFGRRRPLHFVVEGDLHIALDGIFLHRTVAWPPLDESTERCVSAVGAFLAYCRWARSIDAIKVGSWLLQTGHTTKPEIAQLALTQPWRDGALEALWTTELLDARTRSLKETELVTLLRCAGMPEPEVNVPAFADLRPPIIPDLWYAEWGVAVEYEGVQHQADRKQYVRDIGRYTVLRERDAAYVVITHELLATPRHAVGAVYRALVSRGYQGPPPDFGERWRSLFVSLNDLLPRKRRRGR